MFQIQIDWVVGKVETTAMNETGKPKRRRWFQFRLRTLLIAVFVLSLPLSWFAVRMEKARRQREAVEAIERLGGGVLYVQTDTTGISSSSWLHRLLETFTLDEIEYVQVWNDDALKYLGELTSVQTLDLRGKVTDAGMEHLHGLTNVRLLHIGPTRVTDAG